MAQTQQQIAQAERMRAWRNGWTVAELRAFLDAHGRKCAICERPEDPTKRAGGLVIDHDHACCPSQDPQVPHAERPKRLCGKCARGLLCVPCNTAIGQFADNPDLLSRAIAYLAREVADMPQLVVLPNAHRGDRHHRSKLTEESVRWARAEYAAGRQTIKAMARELGVRDTTLGYAINGTTWAHIK